MTSEEAREVLGCQLLERAFVSRGYRIVRDFRFDEDGITCSLDGWDPDARVGFEYLTRHGGDHEDLDKDELGRLSARIERGELYLFVIDEIHLEPGPELERAAGLFLDEVERRAGPPVGRGKRGAM